MRAVFLSPTLFAGVGEPNGLRVPGGRGLASQNTAVRCFGEARHENKERRKRGYASRPLRLCFRKGRQIPPPQPPAVPTPNSEGRGAVFGRSASRKQNPIAMYCNCRHFAGNGGKMAQKITKACKTMQNGSPPLQRPSPIKEYRFLQIPTS